MNLQHVSHDLCVSAPPKEPTSFLLILLFCKALALGHHKILVRLVSIVVRDILVAEAWVNFLVRWNSREGDSGLLRARSAFLLCDGRELASSQTIRVDSAHVFLFSLGFRGVPLQCRG